MLGALSPSLYVYFEQEMMQKQFSRTRLLLGSSALDTLAGSYVAVFGVGGVGINVYDIRI